MPDKRFHIGSNGPSICKADPSKPNGKECPLGGEHFSSMKEAEEHFEKIMEKEGSSSTPVTISKTSNIQKNSENYKKSLEKISENVSEVLKENELKNVPLEDIERIGESIDSEIFSRAGVESKDSYTQEELQKLSESSSRVLKDLQEREISRTNSYHGPHSKYLEEAVSVLPSGAVASIKGDIYTKNIHGNTKNFDGQHISKAEVPRDMEETDYIYNDLDEKIEPGEFYLRDFNIEDNVIALRVSKKLSDRPSGGLEAGMNLIEMDSAKPYYRDLIKNDYVDDHGNLKPEAVDEVKRRYPAIEKDFKKSFRKRDYWVGDRKGLRRKKGDTETYKKVADEVTVTLLTGEKKTLKKPLYEINDTKTSYTDHTIQVHNQKLKKGDEPSNEYKSVLLHEFTHAVQDKSGAPGEGEIFTELSRGRPDSTSQNFTFYKGFPDDYMGLENGREILTRSTEGIFYPRKDNPYMYSESSENSKRLRNYTLGFWALVSKNHEAKSL